MDSDAQKSEGNGTLLGGGLELIVGQQGQQDSSLTGVD